MSSVGKVSWLAVGDAIQCPTELSSTILAQLFKARRFSLKASLPAGMESKKSIGFTRQLLTESRICGFALELL